MSNQSQISNTCYEYLPHTYRGINKTQVFIKVELTEEIPNVNTALRFLHNKPSPLILKKTSQEGLTVILEANSHPKIVFGLSAPSSNVDADIIEIIDVLAANGLQVKVQANPSFEQAG